MAATVTSLRVAAFKKRLSREELHQLAHFPGRRALQLWQNGIDAMYSNQVWPTGSHQIP